MYVDIWEYTVKSDFRNEFLESYGSQGVWAKLFRRGKGYLFTEFLEDNNDTNHFVTIDYWDSVEEYHDLRKTFSGEYDDVDKICRSYTLKERQIGDFALVGNRPT